MTAATALFAGVASLPVTGEAVETAPEPAVTVDSPDVQVEPETPALPEAPVDAEVVESETPAQPETPGDPEVVESEVGEPDDPRATVDPELPELDGLVESELTDLTGQTELDLDLDAALDFGLQPMALGPDGSGLAAPYVFWRAVDEQGDLVPGATFELQGPATYSWFSVDWGSTATVEDYTGQSDYSGRDLDPDPGEFAVMYRGNQRISDSNRYRVRPSQTQAPAGYVATTTGWEEISGRQNSPAAPSQGEWISRTHDFGDFAFLSTATDLSCTPGTFYSVSSGGTLYEVSGGTRTTIGSWSGLTGDANAVAISQGGDVVYAIDRNTSNAGRVNSILRYTPSTGVFERISSTGVYTDADSLVAGAVNLSNGDFLFGGFSDNGGQFHIYRFTGSGTPGYLGYFETGSEGTANGDMAFDSAGNLYVVRSGNSTNIYTVTAENLAAASGGQIPATATNPASLGLSNVNGAAFDADGSIYLGNGSTVRKFDPTNWQSLGTVTSNLNNSTDLASCSSPATLTVTKNVIGRAAETDQFRLAVSRNDNDLASVETEGTEDGVQDIQVGPMAVRSGNTYTVSETFIEGASGEDYTTSLRCVDELGTELVNEPATDAEVTIPFGIGSSGAVVECEFTNAPLVSFVDIVKYVEDESGVSATASGWTVGAAAQNTVNGDVTADPVAATQETDEDGVAKWKFHYDTTDTVADIVVSEEQQDGYEFENGTCVVTPPTGASREIDLTESEDTIGGIVDDVTPGSRVACEFHNKKMSSELTLIKEISGDFDPEADDNQWVLQAEGEGKTYAGVTGSDDVTDVKVRPGVYTLSEALDTDFEDKAEGYTWERLTCVDESGEDPLTLLDVDMTTATADPTVEVPNGGDVECTFTNATKPGSIAWTKIAAGSELPLAGSEWELTGPGHAEGTVITGNDAGEFLVENLQWGEYTVTETKAPAGYVLGDPAPSFTATITPDQLQWSYTSDSEGVTTGGVENEQVGPVTLPIAGGTGTWMFAGGGALLLLAAAAGWLYTTRRNQQSAGEL